MVDGLLRGSACLPLPPGGPWWWGPALVARRENLIGRNNTQTAHNHQCLVRIKLAIGTFEVKAEIRMGESLVVGAHPLTVGLFSVPRCRQARQRGSIEGFGNRDGAKQFRPGRPLSGWWRIPISPTYIAADCIVATIRPFIARAIISECLSTRDVAEATGFRAKACLEAREPEAGQGRRQNHSHAAAVEIPEGRDILGRGRQW